MSVTNVFLFPLYKQGASLFAYNNAQFQDKDWEGIRMLQDSIKEKDPMKVGRFGLGFKAVLHMTGEITNHIYYVSHLVVVRFGFCVIN